MRENVPPDPTADGTEQPTPPQGSGAGFGKVADAHQADGEFPFRILRIR